MGIEIEGIDQLEYLIRQGGAKAQKGASEQMKREATRIRDLARKFAPIDEGNLEDAIQIEEVGGGRNETGQFQRKSYNVFVDMFHPAQNDGIVGQYAYIMHEHLAPFGPYKLGPRSRAKQAGQGEMVGGLYMDRAVAEVMRGMVGRLARAASDQL